MAVDIKGICKWALLRGLWDRAPVAAFFKMNRLQAPQFDMEEALRHLNHDPTLDYVCGRPIKCNIWTTTEVNPRLYDRDAGDGVFADVVTSLRLQGLSSCPADAKCNVCIMKE